MTARRDVLIALGLALAPVIALGFSRFAYALLLPPMRQDLDWSYTAAGGMNTANAIGYVAGAASAAVWAKRWGARRTFTASLAVSAGVLTATGLTSSYDVLMALRTLGGVSTAVAFVVGSSLAARLRPALLPVYFAGVGVGVVTSGVVVPLALSGDASDDWRLGWALLGLASLLALVPAYLASRAVPTSGGGAVARLERGEIGRLGFAFVAYVLFGAGYVSYMTFVVALLRDGDLAAWVPTVFWIVLGVASSAFIAPWGRRLATCHGGNGIAAVSAVVLLGTAPLLIEATAITALVSAIIFGSTFMAGPSAVTSLCRRVLRPEGWTAGIALMTTGFALGQAFGPLLSGWLSDSTGDLRTGLLVSPVLLAAAALAALRQAHHPDHGDVRAFPTAAEAPPRCPPQTAYLPAEPAHPLSRPEHL